MLFRSAHRVDRAALVAALVDGTIDAVTDVFHHHFSSVVHVAWAAGFVVLLVVVARRLPSSYAWYCGATLLVALSAHNLDSLERYVMSSFPFVIGLALLWASGIALVQTRYGTMAELPGSGRALDTVRIP